MRAATKISSEARHAQEKRRVSVAQPAFRTSNASDATYPKLAVALSFILHAAAAFCLAAPSVSKSLGDEDSILVEIVALSPPPELPAPLPEPARKIEPPPAKPVKRTAPPPEKIKAAPIDAPRDMNANQATRNEDAPAPVMTELPSPIRETTAAAASDAPALSAARLANARDYAAIVWKRIMRHKPEQARFLGNVTVRFVIAQDGGLTETAVMQSGGTDALDRSALEAVHKAAPFPPPPQDSGPAPVAFTIQFQFR